MLNISATWFFSRWVIAEKMWTRVSVCLDFFHVDFQLKWCFYYQLSWEDVKSTQLIKQSIVKFLGLTLTQLNANLASFEQKVSGLSKDSIVVWISESMSRRDEIFWNGIAMSFDGLW